MQRVNLRGPKLWLIWSFGITKCYWLGIVVKKLQKLQTLYHIKTFPQYGFVWTAVAKKGAMQSPIRPESVSA